MDKLELAKKRMALKQRSKTVVAKELATKIGNAYAERDIEKFNKAVTDVLDDIGQKFSKAISELPTPEAPSVTVDTDTTKLEDIAQATAKQLEALQRTLDAKPTIDSIKAVAQEISTLKQAFGDISKALEQDIYARYDYTNSIEENGVRYVGYLNKDSDWFVQRLGSSTDGETSSFATGKRGAYKQAWRDRLKLNYVLRDKADIV